MYNEALRRPIPQRSFCRHVHIRILPTTRLQRRNFNSKQCFAIPQYTIPLLRADGYDCNIFAASGRFLNNPGRTMCTHQVTGHHPTS